ncbi:MAG: helix-turn-helix domain-containing protein [Sphingobacteriales bacterium]|uniref:helix-turn-helix domain-containing protein n=1 Tax=Hydrotalea flava TaxID=714549 RepID=UPI00082D75F8|nr:AraC family transcriptional regulator [Hydrotalea flava]RTL48578.1 MAG: helix-turn-helix domain-containing protein [Sphingobacteriales bacterium]
MYTPPQLLKEVIPLTQNDCFTIFSRVKTGFDFPLHFHEEFELNFIINAKNSRRIIGDHIGETDELELVLVGSNLQHGWFTHQCSSKEIREITIQFHRDLFDDKFLRRNQLSFIKNMFDRSCRGILFSKETTELLKPRLIDLPRKQGFDSVLELLSILHDLSTSRNMQILSDTSFTNTDNFSYNSRRIEKVMEYMNRHFEQPITLAEVAGIAAMTEVSFSRFFKNRTGQTFVDTLNEIRIGHAARLLIETTHSINEIADKCGFNNMSNFNRAFKKRKKCTPKNFRETYTDFGTRTFI